MCKIGGIYLTFNSVLIKLVLWVTEEKVQIQRSGHAPEGTENFRCRRDKENIAKIKTDKESAAQIQVSSPVPKPKYERHASPL